MIKFLLEDLLTPPVNHPEVLEWYTLFKTYFQILRREKIEYPRFKYISINPKYIPKTKSQEEKIIHRLTLIKKYRLKDPRMIIRILKTAIPTPKVRLNAEDLKFLNTLIEHPGIRVEKAAEIAKIPVSTAYRIRDKLKKVILLRTFGYPNLARFRLKNMIVTFEFFEDRTNQLKNMMTANPFLFTLNIDAANVINGRVFGWASFRLPNSKKVLDEFYTWLVSFKEREIFPSEDSWEILDTSRFIYSVNLDFFDGTQYLFDDSMMSIGLMKFLESVEVKTKKPMMFMELKGEPINFDKIDLILLELLQSDYFFKLKEARKALERHGFFRSEKNISMRFERLRKFMQPAITFVGLELTDYLYLFISTTDSDLKNRLHAFFYYLPMVYIAETNTDMVVYLKLPRGTAVRFLYQFSEMRNEFDKFVGIIAAFTQGARVRAELYKYWNEKRQRWEVPEGIMWGLHA
ncbi:MAG: hypothetical protein ACP6IS_02375 [Candidatus Asgardarchaeia archaeon]